ATADWSTTGTGSLGGSARAGTVVATSAGNNRLRDIRATRLAMVFLPGAARSGGKLRSLPERFGVIARLSTRRSLHGAIVPSQACYVQQVQRSAFGRSRPPAYKKCSSAEPSGVRSGFAQAIWTLPVL